jgi:Carboxypeptidase regulatory-like domain
MSPIFPGRASCALLLCLAGPVALVRGQQAIPIPPGPNVIAGRVLDMSSDAPVAGAAVTLTFYPVDEQKAREEGISLPTRNVLTTADGTFVARSLPEGRYSLAVTAFGYQRSDYLRSQIDVKDAAKPATITLRVWKHGSISGRITDEHGEPVVGVPVYAHRRLSIGGVISLERAYVDASSDDRGIYRIPSLPPGSYVVGVMPSAITIPASLGATIDSVAANRTAAFNLRSQLGYASSVDSGAGLRQGDWVFQRPGPPPVLAPDGRVLTYSTTLFPGTSNAADATLVRLQSGESRSGIDIPLRFQPGMRVSGIVTGAGGPVPNLAVRLAPPDIATASMLEALGEARAITGADGRFTFLGVSPGRYLLKAAQVSGDRRTPDSFSTWAEQPLAVGDTDIKDLAVTMRGGTEVRGRVEFRGTPPETSERIFLMLRPIAAESWNTLGAEIRSDGTFTTGSDPPGRYEIYASSASGWRNIEVSHHGKILGDFIVELGTGGISDLVVTMSRTPCRLSGAVTGGQGSPDADAVIIVFPADTSLWREGIFQSRRVQRTYATNQGAFSMNALTPGEYYAAAVNARVATEWQDAAFFERLIPGAVKVALGDGDDKTVALRTFTPRAR